MGSDLRIAACRAECDWGPTDQQRGGLTLFACRGCGSQWLRSEPWTPANADGDVPDAVAAEAARSS